MHCRQLMKQIMTSKKKPRSLRVLRVSIRRAVIGKGRSADES